MPGSLSVCIRITVTIEVDCIHNLYRICSLGARLYTRAPYAMPPAAAHTEAC